MRIVPLGAILFCCAVAGAAEHKDKTTRDDGRYVIECRITTTDDDGKTTSLMAPSIHVGEGAPAKIKDVTQTPFATGIIRKDGRDDARVTVLEEGTTIEATVFPDRDDCVMIDATIKTSQITGVETKPIGKGDHRQCPRTESRTVRIIDTVKLGEELEIEVKGPDGAPRRTVELVVSSPSMPRHWKAPETESKDILPDLPYAKPPAPNQRGSAMNNVRPSR